jgi:hypothetical protein
VFLISSNESAAKKTITVRRSPRQRLRLQDETKAIFAAVGGVEARAASRPRTNTLVVDRQVQRGHAPMQTTARCAKTDLPLPCPFSSMRCFPHYAGVDPALRR